MQRVFLIGLFWACQSAAVWGSDPRADEPYRLAVCLKYDDDPVFTRFFTASVERQTRDHLAAYFDRLAEVQVSSRHAVLDKLDSTSLAELTMSPAEFVETDCPDKVFLVEVDFQEGLYRLRWRQLDGDLRQVGPLHVKTTPDRQWLAKALCLAIKQDFAPVAWVEARPKATGVDLTFRGADLSSRLASWCSEGCVLQPYRIVRQGDGSLIHTPIPHTMLVVDEGDDGKKARVITRLADPWKTTPRIAGFRAIKLSTQTGRFRLRIIDATSGSPVRTAMVHASDDSFDALADEDRLADPNKDGYVVATKDFDNLAYITISQRKGASIRLLLPITDDWCELECRITDDPRAGVKADWQRRLRYRVQDVRVLQSMLDRTFEEVNDLNREKQYEEALERVRSADESITPMITSADYGLGELESLAAEIGEIDKALSGWTRQRIDELQRRAAKLSGLGEDLQSTIEGNRARDRAKVLAKLAQEEENQHNVDRAIENYQLALEEWPEMPQVKEHLDELEESWRIEGPEHEQARRFVFETWASAKSSEVEALLDEARLAFRFLADVDDYLTVRKLMRVNGEHMTGAMEIADAATLRDGEADREEAAKYDELAERIAELQDEVAGYLDDRR